MRTITFDRCFRNQRLYLPSVTGRDFVRGPFKSREEALADYAESVRELYFWFEPEKPVLLNF